MPKKLTKTKTKMILLKYQCLTGYSGASRALQLQLKQKTTGVTTGGLQVANCGRSASL